MMAMNINGALQKKLPNIRSFLKKHNPDFLALSETWWQKEGYEENHRSNLNQFKDIHFTLITNGLSGEGIRKKRLENTGQREVTEVRTKKSGEKIRASEGLALLVADRVKPYIRQLNPDAGGRIKDRRSISVELKLDDSSKPIRIHALYGPTNSREKRVFWKDWKNTLVRDKNESEHILFGDLNVAPDPEKDRKSKRADAGGEKLRKMIDEGLVVDIYRRLYPNEIKYTWHREFNEGSGKESQESRIDLFLATGVLPKLVTECGILEWSDIQSDHSPITMTLELPNLKVDLPSEKPELPQLSETKFTTDRLQQEEVKARYRDAIKNSPILNDTETPEETTSMNEKYCVFIKELLRIATTVVGTKVRVLNRRSHVLDDTTEVKELKKCRKRVQKAKTSKRFVLTERNPPRKSTPSGARTQTNGSPRYPSTRQQQQRRFTSGSGKSAGS